METISPSTFEWHVRFLAHDLLSRGTGQRGRRSRAETWHPICGIWTKTAGDNGSYLQKVRWSGHTLPDTIFSLPPARSGDELTPRRLVATDQTQQPSPSQCGDRIRGLCIEAPEYNWDDYKGTDCTAKCC